MPHAPRAAVHEDMCFHRRLVAAHSLATGQGPNPWCEHFDAWKSRRRHRCLQFVLVGSALTPPSGAGVGAEPLFSLHEQRPSTCQSSLSQPTRVPSSSFVLLLLVVAPSVAAPLPPLDDGDDDDDLRESASTSCVGHAASEADADSGLDILSLILLLLETALIGLPLALSSSRRSDAVHGVKKNGLAAPKSACNRKRACSSFASSFFGAKRPGNNTVF